MKSFSFHVRKPDGNKITGGSIHADSFDHAADRLATRYSVSLTNSGRAVFTCPEGRGEISLYLHIAPEDTPGGLDRAKMLRAEQRIQQEQKAREQKEREAQLESLIESIGIEAAIKKLSAD